MGETVYIAGTHEAHEHPRTVGVYRNLSDAREAAERQLAREDGYDDVGAFVRAWVLGCDCGLVGHHTMARGASWESHEVLS